MSGDGAMRTWYTHELHPLCTLFPRLQDAELQALADDIRANGLQSPIVLHDGMILDGGNRYRACQIAGVEPHFVQFAGGSIVQFVLSANLHRRHLALGQAAAIASLAQDWAKAQTVGNPAFRTQSCNVAPLATAADRAAESGASLRTQKMADKVARESPELAVKVAHGEISLPKAVEQIAPKRDPVPTVPATQDEVHVPPRRASQPVVSAPEVGDSDSLRMQVAELQERIAELGELADELREDRDSMARVFEANDQVVAALAEAKRYREQVRILEARIRGQASECAQAKQAAKMWKAKHDKLERARANLAA